MPTGGSRADGTVEVTANRVGRMRSLIVDWESTDSLVRERCQAWGFSSATRFGGVEFECSARDANNNCLQDNHKYAYQSID